MVASDAESDVSLLTISDDDAHAPNTAAGRRSGPAAVAPAGGSARPAATTAAAGAGTSGAKPRRRKGRVEFQLPDDDDDDEAHRTSGRLDGDARDDGAIEDDTKPLGWSYFRKRDPSEGPVTWSEVDVEELKFVAESLVRSTTTRASQPDDDVIHQIFQAGPGEEDALVSDPLGRGYIDPLTLTLGKKSKMARQAQPSGGEKGLNATMRTFRTARLSAKQQQAGAGGAEGAAGSSSAGPGSSGMDEETRKVLPNQEGFEPEAYLATFHADTSMSQLEKGLRSLSRELSERTGQLKHLIRNNFDRFISCKDAIDDIHAKLRRMLVRGGGGAAATTGGAPAPSGASAPSQAALQQQQGVGTERVFRSLEQVEAQARRTFGPILERAARADRIRAVAGLLQRFDHLFALPQRILELAGRGELEQVVREYKRVNLLIRPTATTARVWISLYAEIEKRITEVYMAVKQLVSEPPPEGRPMGQDGPTVLFGVAASSASGTGSGAADSGDDLTQERLHQLPDYLLFMTLVRQEHLPAARDDDAMRMYVNRLGAHVDERIQACDQRHTEQLGQLVTAWMKATSSGPSGSGGGASALSQLRASSNAVASLQASFASVAGAAAAAPGPTGQGRGGGGGGGGGAEESGDEEEADDGDSVVELDDEAEAAEAAFLLWQGSAAEYGTAASSSGTASLPYHIRRELPRLVQDPGGQSSYNPMAAAAAYGGIVPLGFGSGLLYGSDGPDGSSMAASGEPLQLLPASAHAPEPALTPGQRQWVSYVCSVSALLLWALPGLWATCNSPKYGSHADLDEQSREGLGRGPSLARRLAEALCDKYATRLKRAVQSLARAGPMQPGLPLVIKDACHLWRCLRRVGVGPRALSALRGGVLGALGQHARLLGGQLGELPAALLEADDFRLDLLAADQQPVTVLPRRLEEELGVALLHFQWPLRDVVGAAGGVEELPADPAWRPMQSAVFACFSLLSEALADYARGLYGGAGGDERGSFRSRVSRRLTTDSDASAGLAATGSSKRRAAALAAGGSADALNADGSGGGGDAAGTTRGSLWSAASGGCDDDMRVLLVISNAAVIRTRVMPGVVERYRRLLAPTAEASLTCQRRLRELTASMRRSNEALGGTYLARKEAALTAAVARYMQQETEGLAGQQHVGQAAAAAAAATARTGAVGGHGQGAAKRAGEGAGAAASVLLGGPCGPSGGCCALLQLLTAIHNEALAYSPSNLRSFMEALAEHLVEQLLRAHHVLAAATPAASSHSATSTAARAAAAAGGGGGGGGGASVEQVVQLWADLAFLSEVLRPLLTASLAADLEEAKVLLGGAIASRQRSRRYRPASAPAAAVAGLGEGEAVSAALQELLAADIQSWLRRHALNVRCFTAVAAAGASATTHGSAKSSGSGAGGAVAGKGSDAAAAASGAAPKGAAGRGGRAATAAEAPALVAGGRAQRTSSAAAGADTAETRFGKGRRAAG